MFHPALLSSLAAMLIVSAAQAAEPATSDQPSTLPTTTAPTFAPTPPTTTAPQATFSVLAVPVAERKPHERLIYTARYAAATDLANTILPIFSHPASDQLIVTTDAASNCLVLSGTPENLAEARKILNQLDRQPKTVSIDIWIVDTRSSGWEGKANKEVDEAMSQSREKFVELLQKLQGQQRLSVINHLQLTAIEGQQASMQAGERKPRVVSSSTALQRAAERERAEGRGGFGGGAARTSNIVLENIGTLLQATARVPADDQIVLQLNLEKSFVAPEETGVPIAENAEGQVLARSSSILSLVCKNSVTLANGQIVEVNSLANNSQEAGGDIRVLVGAQIRPSQAKAKAEKQ